MLQNTLRNLIRIEANIIQKRNNSHVAFIGLGQMGARMATNLVNKGQTVKVYDVVPAFKSNISGAQPCETPHEAVKNSKIVITMLPNGSIVRDTVLGKNGILSSIPKGSYLLDCSTTEPQLAQDLFEEASKSDVKFLDAPVSGGVVGAQAGTLTFMVGGKKEDVTEVEPVLLKMGAKVLHCGKSGAGQITKLCNNLILGITMIGTAEAMNLGIKLGIDPKILTSVVNISTGRSWSSDTYHPVPGVMENVPASNDYKGGFSVKLIAKDLGLASDAAKDISAPIPLGAMTHQLYRSLITHGFEDKDFTVIYEFLKGKQ